MNGATIPTQIMNAMHEVLDYLWADEAAHCLETSPLEGRDEHIFHTMVEVRRWLDQHTSRCEDGAHDQDKEGRAG